MFGPKGFILPAPCVILLLLFLIWPGHGSEIIGGKPVEPHSLRYMALVKKPGMCGGTLIDPMWVLTAAHCAGQSSIKEVFLGVHSIKADEKDSRQVVGVQRNYPHPCYDAVEKVNDLMLLKLKKKVKETDTVKCLRLGSTVKEPEPGTKCLVAGWGKTSYVAKQGSDILMSVNVTVISRQTCNSPEYYNFKPIITNSMLCAGSDGKKKADTCQGDSGGPLLCNRALVGVTSFGHKCGLPKKPGVYSLLTDKQLMWIKSTMKISIQ
ncbi:granzyme A-like [Brachionichthys hirsutus]|uniref:granzyme A-like n=1 Tax=Brachionichthys hirsutus TaxID=412623 RepID=UPI00360510BA